MDRFAIILRNEKRKFYDRFAIFIFLLNGAGLILATIYSGKEIIGSNITIVLLICAAGLMIGPPFIILQKERRAFQHTYLLAATSILVFWIILGYWWAGLLVFMLILFYIYSKRDLVVKLNTEGILYPSFPNRAITWNELSNVILKDRLLTIDFKNNRIIQQDIDAESYAVKEEEFNEFCKKQLELNAKC